MIQKLLTGGRPTLYSENLIDEICSRIAQGRSLRNVCLDDDMPAMSSVMKWLDENKEFSEQYREATTIREDLYFDEVLCIADSVKAEPAEIAKARLQIDSRKWVLSRMNPKKYGDKQSVELAGKNGNNLIPSGLGHFYGGIKQVSDEEAARVYIDMINGNK